MKKVKKKEVTPVKKKLFFLPIGIFLFALLLFLDQYTKHYMLNHFSINQSILLIPGVWLTYIQNTGITWGLLKDTNALMIYISIIIFGLLLFFYDKFTTTTEKIAYTLIIAGLWGNLIDRILHGFVIDFIDLHWWPVFNIADACITVGIILYLVASWKKY